MCNDYCFTGPYKHPACLTELSNGDFYLVYYGGAGEYAMDTGVFGSRLRKGSTRVDRARADRARPVPIGRQRRRLGSARRRWSGSSTWSDTAIPGRRLGFRSRFRTTTRRPGRRRRCSCSTRGTLVRNRPIVLSNGDYLLPLYHESGHDTEMTGPDSYSFFLRYSVKDKGWTKTGPIRSPKGNIQPSAAQLADRRLVAYCRRGGDYRPETIGYIVRSESVDGGLTWSEGVDSAFPNPNAAVDLLTSKNGHLLLVYNNSMNRRTPLTLALSLDHDRTWPVRRDLRSGDNDYGYPIALQAARRPDPRDLHLRPADGGQPRVVRRRLGHPWIVAVRDRPGPLDNLDPFPMMLSVFSIAAVPRGGRARASRRARRTAQQELRSPEMDHPFPLEVLRHVAKPLDRVS